MDPDDYERDIIKPVHVRVCNVLYVYGSRKLRAAAVNLLKLLIGSLPRLEPYRPQEKVDHAAL